MSRGFSSRVGGGTEGIGRRGVDGRRASRRLCLLTGTWTHARLRRTQVYSNCTLEGCDALDIYPSPAPTAPSPAPVPAPTAGDDGDDDDAGELASSGGDGGGGGLDGGAVAGIVVGVLACVALAAFYIGACKQTHKKTHQQEGDVLMAVSLAEAAVQNAAAEAEAAAASGERTSDEDEMDVRRQDIATPEWEVGSEAAPRKRRASADRKTRASADEDTLFLGAREAGAPAAAAAAEEEETRDAAPPASSEDGGEG